jgi:hypothetical protein
MRLRVAAAVVVTAVAGVAPAALAQVTIGPIRVVEPLVGAIVEPPFVVTVANAAEPGSEEASQVQITIDGRALDPDGGFVPEGGRTFFDLAPGERLEIVVERLGKGRHELGLAVMSPGNVDAQAAEPYTITVPPQPTGTGRLGFAVILALLIGGFVFTRRRLMSRRPRAE